MEKIDSILQSRIPIWVSRLLEKSFFEKCPAHDLQKNGQNRYCITCDASLCRYCVKGGDHKGHKILTICRHVYQNSVPLSEMEMHLACDNIQPYKCNKKWVVSMNPLPHTCFGPLIEVNGACIVCKQKLTDPECFRFCPITCKVQEIFRESEGTSRQENVDDQEAEDAADQEPDNPLKRKRSRKGMPVRAPSSVFVNLFKKTFILNGVLFVVVYDLLRILTRVRFPLLDF